jgi:MFS family permease
MAEHERPVDLTVEPLQPEKSLGELIGTMSSDLSLLMRQEVQLAKLELREEGKRAGRAGGMFGGAAVAGLIGAIILAMSGAWLLDQWMPRALAFLIIAVILLAVAAVLASKGKAAAKQIDPVPHQTVETVKEDVAWAKAQKP